MSSLMARHRAAARQAADERERRHELRGDDRKWIPNGLNGSDTHYVGILGEMVMHLDYGCSAPDLGFIARGDKDVGGDIFYRGYTVDVKVSTYYGRAQYLRVPCDRMHEGTVYVAAVYDPDTDDVHALRWEWGWQLVRENNIQRFGNHPTDNYVKLVAKCRRMCEFSALTEQVIAR